MLLAGLMTVSLLACANGKSAEETKPGVVVTQVSEITATVSEIDYDQRTVTLQGPQRAVTLKVDESAKNFEQVKVGDQVKVEFLESVALFVKKSQGGPPAVKSGTAVTVAPLGEKPAIGAVDTVVVTAEVEAIDYGERTVTLKGPEGNSRTFKVGPDVEELETVKIGDKVVAQYTVAVAVSVSTP
jgi:hypothetical protein